MRVFIETTIPSYLTARPARDIVQSARQQVTRDWWDNHRHYHDLFTSQAVLDEAAAGDPSMARARLKLLDSLTLLDIHSDVTALATRIVSEQILPSDADYDAVHLAVATVHGMDILLSLNFRHIVNGAIQHRLRRLTRNCGYELPVICTPEELLEESK
ncbi:MAG: hypothetical protein A2Z34_10450 [Planctomycetes bacterium RBG_16_59_8]|nr:MAG: hypothetical protein A2Z34_10450 [Planctomycetes bacterium RBG_16_59_8]